VTFSIVAADPETGEVGVAVQSKYFAVGAVVPWARAGIGAVATQAAGVAVYGPQILERLQQGSPVDDALAGVLAEDPDWETRQIGVVTAAGEAISLTGEKCIPWAGSIVRDHFAVQGNILAGPEVVEEMARAFEDADGPLGERMLAALEAGQEAGGDRRGQQSAALMVERTGAHLESRDGIERIVDLRVDDHPLPIDELRRLWNIQLRWDALRRASGFYRGLDYARGIAILGEANERFPDDATILYDLACYEALDGRHDAAIEHVGRAIELEPGYREAAGADEDFATLRRDPAFRALVSD
jgi:uncharacterized Ntn-hydrolase superfamily protein